MNEPIPNRYGLVPRNPNRPRWVQILLWVLLVLFLGLMLREVGKVFEAWRSR